MRRRGHKGRAGAILFWPAVLGLVAGAGLLLGLMADGAWDGLASFLLAAPVLVGSGLALRRRNESRAPTGSGPERPSGHIW